jgi:hypothetical protein
MPVSIADDAPPHTPEQTDGRIADHRVAAPEDVNGVGNR